MHHCSSVGHSFGDPGSARRAGTATHSHIPRQEWTDRWKGFVFADFSTSAIYTSEPNGKDIQQVTFPDTGVQDDLPKWSPRGTKIIFERDAPTYAEIDEINSNGTGLHKVGDCTGNCIVNQNPDFSPNGKEVVFVKFFGDANNLTSINIWIMNADGTNPRPVTKQKIERSHDAEPSWSPMES